MRASGVSGLSIASEHFMCGTGNSDDLRLEVNASALVLAVPKLRLAGC